MNTSSFQTEDYISFVFYPLYELVGCLNFFVSMVNIFKLTDSTLCYFAVGQCLWISFHLYTPVLIIHCICWNQICIILKFRYISSFCEVVMFRLSSLVTHTAIDSSLTYFSLYLYRRASLIDILVFELYLMYTISTCSAFFQPSLSLFELISTKLYDHQLNELLSYPCILMMFIFLVGKLYGNPLVTQEHNMPDNVLQYYVHYHS